VHPSELGDHVLVIAPHPDDEVLVAGGTVHSLRARGAHVRILLLTAGDAYLRAARRIGRFAPDAATYRRLGEIRFRESVEAASVLGVPESDVVCLGYPDGRLEAMWGDAWEPDAVSAGCSGAAAVPYPWAYRPGAPCCGAAMGDDLAAIVRDLAPDTVIFPNANETHGDHAASHRFVAHALAEAGSLARGLTYLVHCRHYPYPWAYRPAEAVRPPRALRESGLCWLSVPLEHTDVAAKEAALRAFPSQNAIPDLRYFMRAFVRANELFAEFDPGSPAGVRT
jgi:LmbE family N-acetylglucosaminyl deacetylase